MQNCNRWLVVIKQCYKTLTENATLRILAPIVYWKIYEISLYRRIKKLYVDENYNLIFASCYICNIYKYF